MKFLDFWFPKWYEGKSVEFLEERMERKSWALGFAVFSLAFMSAAVTRIVIGRPFDWGMFAIAVVVMAVAAVWFRIAYMSKVELKRRGLLKD